MDETGVLGLIEGLLILLEDSKPVFGKNNLRQVDITAAFEIMDESAIRSRANSRRRAKSFVSVRASSTMRKPRALASSKTLAARL